jgi:hypothetical protein
MNPMNPMNPMDPMDPTNPKPLLIIIILAIAVTLAGGCSRQTEYIELSAEIVLPQSNIAIREGESVLFRASAAGGTPPYRYVWNFGLAAPDFSGPNAPEIIFNYEGAYTVMLKVTDSRQKQAADEVKIMVTRRETIY